MCIPTITIITDGRKKRHIRGHPPSEHPIRPLSLEARGYPPQRPPTGVITARPIAPGRCPVPIVDIIYAKDCSPAREQVKARPPKAASSETTELSKKEGVRKETFTKIVFIDKRDQRHRRRSCSSISTASNRSLRKVTKRVGEMLRRQDIDAQARRLVEAERKLVRKEMEELQQRQYLRHKDREMGTGNLGHGQR